MKFCFWPHCLYLIFRLTCLRAASFIIFFSYCATERERESFSSSSSGAHIKCLRLYGTPYQSHRSHNRENDRHIVSLSLYRYKSELGAWSMVPKIDKTLYSSDSRIIARRSFPTRMCVDTCVRLGTIIH